jgi:TolB-like protein/AraC-like DNA-binding protein/Tfp pilus assembly protein PilF
MSQDAHYSDSFALRARGLVLEHLSNENFGVSELAEQLHMSRSSLLRNIKKETGQSASQFIRSIRLEEAAKLLKESSLTVSEVSYQVGFNSPSYFIRCFREEYGHPPGELSKIEIQQQESNQNLDTTEIPESFAENDPREKSRKAGKGLSKPSLLVLGTLFIVALLSYAFFGLVQKPHEDLEKSIAVLPFSNESTDSSNAYFVNGLMESTLNKLQKIAAFRVVSRTSTEQFRNSKLGAAAIGETLGVSYLVEGSGQRVGSKVRLTVQLIDAANDKPVWSEQYTRNLEDVFTLQNEVAAEIAKAIEVTISPKEQIQIDKQPTENLEAYDFYLQALEPFNWQTKEGLLKAIPLFKKAIEKDPEFALAHANTAIAYYYLDLYQRDKKHIDELNNYADKALLYDPKLTESLVAKALYYIQVEDFRLALPHLEKALEYNPNSFSVVQILSTLYAFNIPNTAKYLQYALKGLQLNKSLQDSIQGSFLLVHLSNAFLQAGFMDQSLKHIDKAIALYPENPYGPLLKTFVTQAIDGNSDRSRRLLKQELAKDTNRIEVLQELGTQYYYREDYDSAFYYFRKVVNQREALNLDLFKAENLKIAVVYERLGEQEQAQKLFRAYANFYQEDETVYQHFYEALDHFRKKEKEEGLKDLRAFASKENYQYWIIVFLKADPILKEYQADQEYQEVRDLIVRRFWENQKRLEEDLQSKGLL